MATASRKQSRILTTLALGAALCAASAASADSIVTDWNDSILEAAVARRDLGPTCTARSLMMIHTAMYNAWSAYDEVAMSTTDGNMVDGIGGADTLANREEAISVAAYHVLMNQYPEQKSIYDARMADRGFDPGGDSNPAKLGRYCAERVIAERLKDGSNWEDRFLDMTNYREAREENLQAWRPLVVNERRQSYHTPHWGMVMPFALSSGSEFRSPPPPAVGSERYNQDVQEILDESAKLDDRRKAIVEYWKTEGPNTQTPPGFHIELSNNVSRERGFTLEQDIKMFFILSSTLHDAGIACWESKRFYNYLRPITAVHRLGDQLVTFWGGPGVGQVTRPATEWQPYNQLDFNTPPFPEYPSGHSTFGAAWARVMTSFTGSPHYGASVVIDSLFVDQREIDPVTLSWDTFGEAGNEDGYSRLPNGVHFRSAWEQGQVLGNNVADKVAEKASHYFTGVARPCAMVLANLSAGLWESGSAEGFTAPSFADTAEGLLLLSPAAPSRTFGYWQTASLDPLPAGRYEMRFYIESVGKPVDRRLPEARFRIFPDDNTASFFGIASPTNNEMDYPEYISVHWVSDGRTPLRIAADLLGASDDIEGGFVLTRITNELLQGPRVEESNH